MNTLKLKTPTGRPFELIYVPQTQTHLLSSEAWGQVALREFGFKSDGKPFLVGVTTDHTPDIMVSVRHEDVPEVVKWLCSTMTSQQGRPYLATFVRPWAFGQTIATTPYEGPAN